MPNGSIGCWFCINYGWYYSFMMKMNNFLRSKLLIHVVWHETLPQILHEFTFHLMAMTLFVFQNLMKTWVYRLPQNETKPLFVDPFLLAFYISLYLLDQYIYFWSSSLVAENSHFKGEHVGCRGFEPAPCIWCVCTATNWVDLTELFDQYL